MKIKIRKERECIGDNSKYYIVINDDELVCELNGSYMLRSRAENYIYNYLMNNIIIDSEKIILERKEKDFIGDKVYSFIRSNPNTFGNIMNILDIDSNIINDDNIEPKYLYDQIIKNINYFKETIIKIIQKYHITKTEYEGELKLNEK